MKQENQPSFSSLCREHDELTRLMDAHQRALIFRNIDAAVTAITAFRSALRRHIQFENERVLPLYADKGAETPGGTLEIFLAEHRKLRLDIDRLTRVTESLYSSRDLAGDIIALLDEEALFKGLLQHHSTREQNLLFPRLDERTTEDERRLCLGR